MTIGAKKCPLKGCSHGAIATLIYLEQLMDCMEFSVIVTTTPPEYLHWIPCNPFAMIKNRSRNHIMWTAL